MKRPDWLKPLTVKEEKIRAANGLTPKRDGWYKSIRGKTRYICKPMPVADAVTVLEARLREHEGTPVIRVAPSTLTIERLVELFLASMQSRVKAGTMTRRTYQDYIQVLSRFCAVVGLDKLAASIGPSDFSNFMATISMRAATTRRREIQYIDRLFNWAGPGKKAMNLIPFVMRGPDWSKPSPKELGAAGDDADKAYTLTQLRAAFEKVANDPLCIAAGHLGFGSGFIPKDLATLPEANVDLDAAVIIFRRGKTGISRLCPLAPEAVQALRDYLKVRPKLCRPKAEGLFFRTRYGNPLALWYEGKAIAFEQNSASRRWNDLTGLPFSGLRSTFATLVDDFPDQRAIDVVLGHSVGKKGRHIRTKHYAKKFKPERARAVVEYAYAQGFGERSPSTAPGRVAAA